LPRQVAILAQRLLPHAIKALNRGHQYHRSQAVSLAMEVMEEEEMLGVLVRKDPRARHQVDVVEDAGTANFVRARARARLENADEF